MYNTQYSQKSCVLSIPASLARPPGPSCRLHAITVWYCVATSGVGCMGGFEIRPFRVRLVLAYPGSGRGRPASVRPAALVPHA